MNNFRVNKLIHDLKGNKKAVIYGAGTVAKNFSEELDASEICIDYFVVTHPDEEAGSIGGIPICGLEYKLEDIKKNNKTIIIAVSDKYYSEIRKVLEQNNITNFLYVGRYTKNYINDDEYAKKEINYYIDQIALWYTDEKKMDFSEVANVENKIRSTIRKKEIEDNNIMFVVGNMSPRVTKMAKSLSDNGYEVNILFVPNSYTDNAIFRAINDIVKCHACETIEELMYRIIISKARIVHVFSNYNSRGIDVANILVNGKDLFPRIVFDQYDIANGMYWTVSDKIMEEEKYCLENSDGLCCRGYELEYLVDELNFDIKGKVVQFFDYVDDNVYESTNCSELSLCYAGYVIDNRFPDATYACWLDLAKLCEENHCHLHIYPTIWNVKDYDEYKELDAKSNYFHFHKPIEYEKLSKELSKYDYYINPNKKGFLECDKNGLYTKKMIYCATNKIFDSLAAGLPIIAVSPVRLLEEFIGKGVILNWTIEEIDFDRLRQLRSEMKRNVVEVREAYKIKNRIYDLIEFYNSLN
jgi:hypothetical protein